MDSLLAEPACQGPEDIIALPEIPDAPFAHGPFLVEADGALRPLRAPAMRFAWRNRPCEARIAGRAINLSVLVGAIPYTAERRGDRSGMLAAIATEAQGLPAGRLLRLQRDARLRLDATLDLPIPSTVTALIASLVGFVLELDFYLDRLEALGVPAG